ncbi:MAG TPA: shikimate dehydrogenase [Anaerolineae bacterium]|nr:shikimate dehydrogenase [Anaerolineae bacterium]HQK12370.1 shikimate dehydrogenase [Anaerolineae bacterium]
MRSFAFIIHPIDPKRDVARKYPLLGKVLSEEAIHFVCRFWPPVQLSHITGARSQATGEEIEGWLIAVPYTPQRMLSLPQEVVYRKIVAAGKLAEKLGAQILGLGAYTSVVGDGGITIAQRLDIPVTSGDSYTAAVAVQATREAARLMDVDLTQVTLAVVGGAGATGAAVAQLLAPDVGRMLLIGRQTDPLTVVAGKVQHAGCKDVSISTTVTDVITAEVVVTVTSSGGNLIQPEMLRRGAVVCDVSRPRDVSHNVIRVRDDVLVIDGGLVRVPGNVDFGFDYGLPPDLTYGCLAETMTLAFEGRFEDYSLGKNLSVAQIQEIEGLATKHGFELAALRSFEHKLDETLIEKVKTKAKMG